MNAKPLSRKDLYDLKVARVGPMDGKATIELDADDWDRVWATLQHGELAPDEPTLAELDRWAAEKIMLWQDSGYGYWTYRGQNVDMGKIMDMETWQPTRNLEQALKCVHADAGQVRFDQQPDGSIKLYVTSPWVDVEPTYEGPYDEHAIALAIMRELYKGVRE